MLWRNYLEVLTVLVSSASWAASLPTSSNSNSNSNNSACTPSAIGRPSLPGAEILNLTASEYNDELVVSPIGVNFTVSFCGVDIAYTHPGWNDVVNVKIWLPLHKWNGRFQGLGGSGWVTGNGLDELALAVSAGYSIARTDGGHSLVAASPSNWALLSPGNLNYPLLQDFAARALADMTILGQATSEIFYGRRPSRSYWNGCSTGGRQGYMLAQRYPELYDGILANAPAINWDSLLVAGQWVPQVINQLGEHPSQCEMESFTRAAIAECDELDGLKDGIISDPHACGFSPFEVVGQPFSCGELGSGYFSSAGATIAEAAWTGPVDGTGKKQFSGLTKDTSLAYAGAPPAGANASSDAPSFSVEWITYFLAKDPSFDVNNITNEEYFALLHQSRNEFSSIIGTSDPDLSLFKASNGKMITFHGLADGLIPPNNTESYYREVQQVVPDVEDFYRYFEAPGVAHCAGGVGAQPILVLEALVQWVEEGIAPDTLSAANVTYGALPESGKAVPTRKLCAWPKKQIYNGGDPDVADSFDCV